ncbi:MAG TPA: hypothetical protein VHH32_12860 [Gemmatimonadales bacterium]|nr:hypothetical protein [Gemmatimonadales bacterium]
MRSRPQEGQNFDLPVISLPQREQNIRASYLPASLSQAERMAYRETDCERREAGKRASG